MKQVSSQFEQLLYNVARDIEISRIFVLRGADEMMLKQLLIYFQLPICHPIPDNNASFFLNTIYTELYKQFLLPDHYQEIGGVDELIAALNGIQQHYIILLNDFHLLQCNQRICYMVDALLMGTNDQVHWVFTTNELLNLRSKVDLVAAGDMKVCLLDGPLTWHELRALLELVNGASVHEAAARLRVSPKTIKNKKSTILRKLELNEMGLMRWAIKRGLVWNRHPNV